MRESKQDIERFLNLLREHAARKSKLYDGSGTAVSTDECLRYAAEELGEVAAALTRNRLELAKCETIDLAHCAMLIWLSLR